MSTRRPNKEAEPIATVSVPLPGSWEALKKIKLQEGATLTTPRQVPIPLMKPVKAKLEHMKKLGVISGVSEPTDWCAGMVVVPKSNGQVRICVNLT